MIVLIHVPNKKDHIVNKAFKHPTFYPWWNTSMDILKKRWDNHKSPARTLLVNIFGKFALLKCPEFLHAYHYMCLLHRDAVQRDIQQCNLQSEKVSGELKSRFTLRTLTQGAGERLTNTVVVKQKQWKSGLERQRGFSYHISTNKCTSMSQA